MTRLPSVTGKELIAVLRRLGFVVTRVKGSHHYLQHADGRAVVVAVHAGETIGRGLMEKILRATKVDPEEFRRHL